jgi:hypothetical protein
MKMFNPALTGAEYLSEYGARHRAPTFASYALRYVERLIGDLLIAEIPPGIV